MFATRNQSKSAAGPPPRPEDSRAVLARTIRQLGQGRGFWAALALLALAVLLEAFAERPEDPYGQAAAETAWRRPMERNAFLRLPAERRPDFRRLAVVPGDDVVLAAAQDGLWRSRDGGANWERLAIPEAGAGIVDLSIPGPEFGYALGGDGWLWVSIDGGGSWLRRATPLSPVESAPTETASAEPPGAAGLLPAARAEEPPPAKVGYPSPETPKGRPAEQKTLPQANTPAPELRSKGQTSMAGRAELTVPGKPVALAFAPDGRNGILAAEHALWQTGDGGRNWTALALPGGDGLRRLLYTARLRAALGRARLHLGLPGTSQTVLGDAVDLVATPDGGFLLLDSGGVLPFAPDGLRSWVMNTMPGREDFRALAFWPPSRLLAVTGSGWLGWLDTSNEPASWQALATGGTAEWTALLAWGEDRLLIAGADGALRYSKDGGKSWAGPEYALNPTPASLLLVLLAVALFTTPFLVPGLAGAWQQLRQRVPGLAPPKPLAESEQIAALAISDLPVQSASDDRLSMLPLAEGLALFLRNEGTKPPLTLAITGDWGSGKTSLMGLLKEQLKVGGMHPIWFNAWHHHQEENLFAALLEQIRSHAIPPAWQYSGLVFRARLLWIRARRQALWLGLLALAGALGWWLPEPRCHYQGLGEGVFLFDERVRACLSQRPDFGQLDAAGKAELGKLLVDEGLQDKAFDTPYAFVAAVQDGLSPPARRLLADVLVVGLPVAEANGKPSWKQAWPVVERWFKDHAGDSAWVSALLAGLLSFLRGTAAFGLRPGQLVRALSQGDGELNTADSTLRARVQRLLNDVSSALGDDKPLVVFIDDLDRCPPEQILRVLEWLNFLSAPPRRAFFILGMALERVLPAIAPSFGTPVAEALRRRDGDSEAAWEGRQKSARRRHALHYLEKLVGLEVAVPAADTALGRLVGAVQCPPWRPGWRERLALGFDAWGPLGVALLLILATALAWGLPTVSREAEPFRAAAQVLDQTPISAESAPAAVSAGAGESKDSAPPSAAAVPLAEAPSGLARLLELVAALSSSIGALGLLAVGIHSQQALSVRDSAEFEEALRIWADVLCWREHTPRHAKRLQNELRLLALRAKLERGQGGVTTAVKLVVQRALAEAGLGDGEFLNRFLALSEEQRLAEPATLLALVRRWLGELEACGGDGEAQARLAAPLSLALAQHSLAAARRDQGAAWPEHSERELLKQLRLGMKLN
ncbi:MAG: hypothetical protein HYV16_07390 [Gammaproteobacteria bacterium]|nr:hypothetical protein [Gammaproteobacteria bacterium]